MEGNGSADIRQNSGASEGLSTSYDQNGLHCLDPCPQPQPPSRPISGDLAQMASTTPQIQSLQQPRSMIPLQALMDVVGGTMNINEDDAETLDEIDEALPTALQSPSLGSSRNFLEELTLLLEEADEEDGWSDEELCGIQEWLAAIGFGEGWQVDADPSSLSSEPRLSKAQIRSLPKEVYCIAKSGCFITKEIGCSSNKPKLEECSVCLEAFASGQMLICLPCNHRFHEDCVTPWLANHAHCPYCRTKISYDGGASSISNSSTSVDERNSQAFPLNHEDVIAWMEAVDSGLLHMGIR